MTEVTRESLATGNAYYAFDRGLVRGIVLDTVNPNGSIGLDPSAPWTTPPAGATAHRRPGVRDLLLRFPNAVLWVNGHTHRNTVIPLHAPNGGGFWEVNTAAHIDWPQQSRVVELPDNRDGTRSPSARS